MFSPNVDGVSSDAERERGTVPTPTTLGIPTQPDLAQIADLTLSVVESGRYSNSGPLAQRLERELAQLLDVPHAVLVSSGTAALTVSLLDLELPAGSEVITTPLTFIATASAIEAAGLRVRFADVDAGTGNLDPTAVEDAITDRTRAILPVHLFGQPCDVVAFGELSRRHDLPLIYDAAHAFGGVATSQSIGRFGTASALSLHATKLMHTGEGGVITTTDADRAERLCRRRNFGLNGGAARWHGFNAKFTEFSAALGLAVLPNVEAERSARARLAQEYDEFFAGIGIPVLRGTDNASLLFYAIAPEFPDRSRVIDALTRAGLTPRIFPALNEAPLYSAGDNSETPGLPTESQTPVASELARRIVALPFHSLVTSAHLDALRGNFEKTRIAQK